MFTNIRQTGTGKQRGMLLVINQNAETINLNFSGVGLIHLYMFVLRFLI